MLALDPRHAWYGGPQFTLSALFGNFEQEFHVKADLELTATQKAQPRRKDHCPRRGSCTSQGISGTPGIDNFEGR